MNEPKKPRQKVTVRAGESRDDLALARFTVVRTTESGAKFPVFKAHVQIVGAHKKNTEGDTNLDGIHRTRVFKKGTYDVVVKAAGMGPVPAPGQPTKLGEFRGKFTFEPLSKTPLNEIEIQLRAESPRIRIKVLEKTLGGTVPLAGARCEVIGVNLGVSDTTGSFVTRPVTDGAYHVLVKKEGFFPQNQTGEAFFRQVDVTPGGIDHATGSRDVVLEVVLATTEPTNIPPFVPDPLTVWASGTSTPHTVRPDPFLASDTTQGQGGWDFGFQFSSFAALASKLHGNGPGGEPIGDHQVSRLGFVAHGTQGVVDVDQLEVGTPGTPTPSASRSLTAARMGHYSSQIQQIARALRQDSVVYVGSCQAGDSAAGEALLKALSKAWPTTSVVGLRTVAAVPINNIDPSPSNPGNLMYAGLRDTRYGAGKPDKTLTRDYENPAIVANLGKLPWMSETSPHATVARDGNIIRRGMPSTGAL